MRKLEPMNKTRQTILYLLCDFITAAIAWTLFFYIRNMYIDAYYMDFPEYRGKIVLDTNYERGLFLIPFMWLSLYYLAGYYRNIYRKSRVKELQQTFVLSLIGSCLLFFMIVLDDNVPTYKAYYRSFWILWGLEFVVMYIPRFIITTYTTKQIRKRKIGFKTLLVGSNVRAEKLYKRLQSAKKSAGNFFVGFVNVIDQPSYQMAQYMPHLGTIDDVPAMLKNSDFDEIIIAIDTKEHDYIEHILICLQGTQALVKAIPDNCDIISGRVLMDSLHDEPLVVIPQNVMPLWQEKVKRICDIIISILVMIFASPLYVFTAIKVKKSSPGPIFYKQERVGRYGNPFYIYKFRSMYVNSEENGPQLASEHDSRITPWGHFMRKTRLDEIPQFYNVLKGDMSLVGPRPERQYFIDKIVKIAPHYKILHKVRPGITSLGQVKYGYAQSPGEMASRMKYDIIYIENMSIYLDFKILAYTVKTVLLGEGV